MSGAARQSVAETHLSTDQGAAGQHDRPLAGGNSDQMASARGGFGAGLVALSAASFGAMAIFARVAYAGGADVTAVLFLRFAIAGVAMAALHPRNPSALAVPTERHGTGG